MKKIILSIFLLGSVNLFAQEKTTEALPQTEVTQTLPEAKLLDDKDLEQTMKQMGRNFKALDKAENLEAMKEPAQKLADYASQAEALGYTKVDEAGQKAYKEQMVKMRVKIVELQQAIEKNDEASARALLKEINQLKVDGHRHFDI